MLIIEYNLVAQHLVDVKCLGHHIPVVCVVLDHEDAVVIVDAHAFEPVGHFAFEVDDLLVVRELVLGLVEVVLVDVDVADGLELVRGGLRGAQRVVVLIAAFFLEREERVVPPGSESQVLVRGLEFDQDQTVAACLDVDFVRVCGVLLGAEPRVDQALFAIVQLGQVQLVLCQALFVFVVEEGGFLLIYDNIQGFDLRVWVGDFDRNFFDE